MKSIEIHDGICYRLSYDSTHLIIISSAVYPILIAIASVWLIHWYDLCRLETKSRKS